MLSLLHLFYTIFSGLKNTALSSHLKGVFVKNESLFKMLENKSSIFSNLTDKLWKLRS